MGLNKSKGNMYEFITHTWNTVKGSCYHDCSYCYMKRWGKQKPVRFDEKELKTDLGKDNFIFVGSSCDMFAEYIKGEWIDKTLWKCIESQDENSFFFQSKNVLGMIEMQNYFPKNHSVCTTIETNRYYPKIMNNAPPPIKRHNLFFDLFSVNKYITIEPIMDFDIRLFVDMLNRYNVKQINIGADSGNNNLPEPPKEKIIELIAELEKFTKVKQKKNLNRLLK